MLRSTDTRRRAFPLAAAAIAVVLTLVPGTAPANQPLFIRGDCNANGNSVEPVTEALLILTALFVTFTELPCRDACDANDDGELDISDSIVILVHHFLGDISIPPPYPECGHDFTQDGLGCEDPPVSCDRDPLSPVLCPTARPEVFVESDFVRGDLNGDGLIDISDSVLLAAVVGGVAPLPSCLDAADVNDDGCIDAGDVSLLAQPCPFLCLGCCDPRPPFPLCGPDPTDDFLDCQGYSGCP